jgi:tetratricopeptide (TPR) repeat protein
LVIYREIGDPQGGATALNNLGEAHSDLGDVARAIMLHEEALKIYREIDNQLGEGEALWNLSLTFDKLNDRTQAISSAEAALKVWKHVDAPAIDAVHEQLAKWYAEECRAS